MSTATTGPIPLVVATTGHTDLRPEDVSALERRVRQVFEHLRERYPHSDVEVLSPLAEGADRLVARVGLAMGFRLIVPLPMELDDYKTDFANPASIAAFDELLSKAARTFVVRGSDGQVAPRPGCYEQVGAYNSTHCHVLLALWNGKTPHKVGGTAEVVRFRLEGVPPAYAGFGRLLDPADTGVVHQIVTPRISDPATSGEPFSLHVRAPKGHGSHGSHEDAIREFEGICESTDAFNRLAIESDHEAGPRRAQSETQLLSAKKAQALTPGAQAVRTLYGYADELAIRFQRRTLSMHRAIFWIVFVAVAAFEVFAHELPGVPPAPTLLAYILLLSGAFGLIWLAERRELDRRYLDYRALAEGLRVQFYWRLGRVPDSVADYYMRYRLHEVEWIRQALRGCELWTMPTDDADGPPAVEALRIVSSDWIEDQRAFFTRAAKRDQASLDTHEGRARIFAWLSFILGVLTAVAILAAPRLTGKEWSALTDEYEYWNFALIAVIGLAPTAAALISGYAEKRALSLHVKRYTHMAFLFQSASKALAGPMASGDWAFARDVLREIGREALEENADWVMVHRERPLEVPQ